RYAHVQKIESENQKIIADIGELTYDYLVIATGSKTNFFGNKGIEKHAMRMKSAPQALNIRSLILENFEEATITRPGKKREALLNLVIVGGGPTGVELSGAIAEVRNNIIKRDYIDIDPGEIHIHLLEGQDRVLAAMSEKSSENAEK